MPWTVRDVDAHKKGLNSDQKRQWIAVANSVLKRCMDNGGSEDTCAISAIRQANGTVKVASSFTFDIYRASTNQNYEVRRETRDGRNYLVVPVVMMVEGVHSGSHGPLLHTIDELGRYPQSWDGRPVVIRHPQVNGVYVSANSPDVLDSYAVGQIYNTHTNGTKLMAEAWLEVDKLQSISPETYQKLEDHELIEVSVGVFTDDEQTSGDWNGEPYTMIARNHRPDHLALLPDEIGACSVEDGCGVRVNNKKGGQMDESTVDVLEKKRKELGLTNIEFYRDPLNSPNINKLFATYQSLKKIDLDISIQNNVGEGFMELMQLIRSKVDDMDNDNTINFVQEVYSDYVIYEARQRAGGAKLYKQGYQLTNGTIDFIGNPVEVQKKVEYINNNSNNNPLNFIRGPKSKPMANEKCTPCVEKKVNALIANTALAFTEADRDWLQAMEESQLDKFIPKASPETNVTTPPVPDKPAVQALSAEDQAALAFGKKQLAAMRKNWIDGIQANTSKELWPDTTLNGMNEDTLERIYNSLQIPRQIETNEEVMNYSLNAGGRGSVNNNASEIEPLLPPGIELDAKK
jgi:hypothetical protein